MPKASNSAVCREPACFDPEDDSAPDNEETLVFLKTETHATRRRVEFRFRSTKLLNFSILSTAADQQVDAIATEQHIVVIATAQFVIVVTTGDQVRWWLDAILKFERLAIIKVGHCH